MQSIAKPQAGEFAPYTSMYIDLLPDDGRVLDHLEHNLDATGKLVKSLPETSLATPFAPGEWTVKEILLHIADDERIYSYRVLRFARNDSTELPGFDQELYTPHSRANERSLTDILEEYASVRAATITLFKNLPEDAWLRAGIANGNRMSVRAAVYHIAGHELHHLNSIRQNYL